MRNLMTVFTLSLGLTLAAQTTRQEVMNNIQLAAGNYYSYPGGKAKLTPAPAGYEPFYISHYGRHGSRYMTSNRPYERTLPLLEKAKKEGLLTPLGLKTYERVCVAAADAEGKGGELSTLGGQQHEQIAERMFRNFPQVFTRDATIDARSTLVHRCQESMSFFCGKLKHLYHRLDIHMRSDASDLYFLANDKDSLAPVPESGMIKRPANAVCDSLMATVRLTDRLFTDPAFVARNLKRPVQLVNDLYDISQDMQCFPELKLSFPGLFTKEELFNIWQTKNIGWVSGCGLIPGTTPHYKGKYHMLRNIINWADDVIASGKKGASLRFGHDSYVLPLAYIMHLKGCYDVPASDFAHFYEHYANFKVIPMAANIQLIFYRKRGSSDVLVKFLFNEAETSIPIPTDCAPYYHWSEVKAYYAEILAQ